MSGNDTHDNATTKLRNLAEVLLDAARRAGADQADALAIRGHSISIDVRGGALEHADSADGAEIGLRVLVGGRQACVSGSDHDQATIDAMASRAVAMAREAPVDDMLGLADPDQLGPRRDAQGLQIADDLPDPTPAELQDLALRTEAATLSQPGISQVEAANASFSRRQLWIAASNGFSGGYERSTHVISAVAITGEGLGMERDYAAESRVWASDLPQPEEIGRLAAERTLARAGSRKPPTGAFPILFDRRVSASLLGHLLGAVNGAAVARGASWLRDALDQPVLPAGMDLIEDPLKPRYPASRPFDAEGLETRSRAIVRDGILQGWTLDLATGRKLGMASTGSAARGLTSAPSPTISNIALTSGRQSRDDLVADMGRGLVVTSMLGASINDTTGDYSRGAAGFWVENGQIAYPVNECTIAGNLRDMLMTLRAANDALPWRTAEVPSLLVEGMTVAGA
ncbi:microcin-processing peptidase 1. Unknown type peptidase. MEROPS family U62 [Paracoccus alcaliphilus]|uniref:PmbA protein n=1 Tax=Paracoccus alcaliphilus TaxID=34002 RepID=A0A1H8GNV3_9RHOB|nr:TldD/PmbA family protein [Paracoccus alcaliphilus]WCR18824.1 TldD/PmbA family protein [Paracoccus alcaliphilus]SEN45791.1 microcin-processing peptidase 1. Unknown type peptidase. MEROPS family U62 [Paracoccus alcaliphilus]